MNQNLKISHQLSVIQNIFFLLLCGLICASHTHTIGVKSHISSFTEEKTQEWERAASNHEVEDDFLLVERLKVFGTELTELIESGVSDYELVLSEIKKIWRLILNANNPKLLENTEETLESLRKYMAEILFLAKARHCKSPDETFFHNRCLPVSTKKSSEHCPENMGLYDDENNEGICDCLEQTREQAKSELRSIYSDEAGVCYQQNTQGPCEYGEWFVLKNTPQCEPVPDGCQTDGRHVYWNPDSAKPKECWVIWTQGPCEEGQRLHLKQDTEELEVYCSFRIEEQSTPVSATFSSPCPPGTFRNTMGHCTNSYSTG